MHVFPARRGELPAPAKLDATISPQPAPSATDNAPPRRGDSTPANRPGRMERFETERARPLSEPLGQTPPAAAAPAGAGRRRRRRCWRLARRRRGAAARRLAARRRPSPRRGRSGAAAPRRPIARRADGEADASPRAAPPSKRTAASRSCATAAAAPAGRRSSTCRRRSACVCRPPPTAASEKSKYGLLPRVGADGARPAEVYAGPFAAAKLRPGAPRVAMLVGGLGLDAAPAGARSPACRRRSRSASRPTAATSTHVAAARARPATRFCCRRRWRRRHAADNPGPHTLKTGATEAENRDSLHWLMGRFPGYVGVVNYLGGKFAADAAR